MRAVRSPVSNLKLVQAAFFAGVILGTLLWLPAPGPRPPFLPPLTEVDGQGSSHRVVLPLPYAPGSPVIANGYAGYIPIRNWNVSGTREQGHAEMFYWLVPRQDFPIIERKGGRNAPSSKQNEAGKAVGENLCSPLIIWLQGGPGASSMIGLLTEMGPYRLNDDGRLFLNREAWTRHYPMLFIDQPVGAGFSFVEPQSQMIRATSGMGVLRDGDAAGYQSGQSYGALISGFGSSSDPAEPYTPDGYVKSQSGVGRDMITFLRHFFARYPDMRRCGLYVTGESYAGKFVPTVATHIIRHNEGLAAYTGEKVKEHPEYIDLKGIAVGNGLTDPASQIYGHAPFALQNGLISREQARILDRLAGHVRDAIADRRLVEANELREELFATLRSFTGEINVYDVRQKDVAYNRTVMQLFLNRHDVRQALHVVPEGGDNNAIREKRKFGEDPAVYESMKEDIMQSATHMFPPLLERGIKVLLYQGQFDIRDGVAGNTDWIHGLEWSGAKGFSQAKREIWRLKEKGHLPTDLAGYYRKHRNLIRAEVLGAGHMVPADGNAPEAMRDLIRRFVDDDWE